MWLPYLDAIHDNNGPVGQAKCSRDLAIKVHVSGTVDQVHLRNVVSFRDTGFLTLNVVSSTCVSHYHKELILHRWRLKNGKSLCSNTRFALMDALASG